MAAEKLTRQDYINKIEELRQAYPEAWANAHSGNEHTEDFVKIVAYELNKLNPAIGLNGKRGNPEDLSDDALCVKNPAGFDFDPTDNNAPRDVIDFIQSAGDVKRAKPTWGIVRDASGNPVGAAWVKPIKPGAKPSKPKVEPKPVEPPAPKLKDRDTFFRELREINDFYASSDGLKRPGGMVIGERADVEALGAWGYNLMLGGTVEQAKAEIRQSFEWKTKHPDGI